MNMKFANTCMFKYQDDHHLFLFSTCFSLPVGLEFKVTMPAPQVVSAMLDMYGCNIIQVAFDRPISRAPDHLCSNYFNDNTVTTLGLQGN